MNQYQHKARKVSAHTAVSEYYSLKTKTLCISINSIIIILPGYKQDKKYIVVRESSFSQMGFSLRYSWMRNVNMGHCNITISKLLSGFYTDLSLYRLFSTYSWTDDGWTNRLYRS